MGSLAVTGIGLLVTNDPSVGDGPLGIVRDASLVIDDGRVLAVTQAPPAADERIDVGGRCVVPGFVDSHTHLVFAGDRADEFAARMAGRPYEAGGIAVTTAATRATPTVHLRALTARRRAEGLRNGITHTEVKSGYGLAVEHEERCCDVAAAFTPDVTFLGAHVVPAEFEGRADDYVHLVCTEMLSACRPHARWIDVFCERGAFDADQARAVLVAGRHAGLGLRVHANQLGHGPGVQLAVELGAASADHCTFLSDDDVDALAASAQRPDGGTVATFLPAADFSTRMPYPDARRAIDAGVRTAIATNCNPGSSHTTSMLFCMALAVRDLHMTAEEALQAATVGGAAALRHPHLGRLGPGAQADFVVLDAPSYTHIAYRPGMPLVRATYVRGRLAT